MTLKRRGFPRLSVVFRANSLRSKQGTRAGITGNSFAHNWEFVRGEQRSAFGLEAAICGSRRTAAQARKPNRNREKTSFERRKQALTRVPPVRTRTIKKQFQVLDAGPGRFSCYSPEQAINST
jgi:hypothetical protein